VRKKLTTRTIDAALKPKAVQYSIGDSGCAGLCIRVTPAGTKTFVFCYRSGANTRWLTLGRYPAVTLAKAHELVADARKALADGRTPTTPRLEAADEKKALTYGALVGMYKEHRLPKLRSGHAIWTTLTKIGHRYKWDGRPAATITRAEAAEMLRHIVASGHGPMANRTKEMLCAMWEWAVDQALIEVNPFYRMKKPVADVRRKRFLSIPEIRTVWRALDEPERFGVSRDAAAALRLILTTACRPGMAIGITGAELHVWEPNSRGPHWELGERRMKMGEPFIAPLSRLAVEVLGPYRERAKTDPAARLFDLGTNDLQQAARRISAGLGMAEPFRPHDLRRTASTHLGYADYEDEQIAHLLAHEKKETVTSSVYVQTDRRWKRFDKKREMAGEIERVIREAIADEPVAAAA
jgi:integrase